MEPSLAQSTRKLREIKRFKVEIDSMARALKYVAEGQKIGEKGQKIPRRRVYAVNADAQSRATTWMPSRAVLAVGCYADLLDEEIMEVILECHRTAKTGGSIIQRKPQIQHTSPPAKTEDTTKIQLESQVDEMKSADASTGVRSDSAPPSAVITSTQDGRITPIANPVVMSASPRAISKDLLDCPHCDRKIGASRFAPHLERCMFAKGRVSSRSAALRLRASIQGISAVSVNEPIKESVASPSATTTTTAQITSPPKPTIPRLPKKEIYAFGLEELSVEELKKIFSNICGAVTSSGKLCQRALKCKSHSSKNKLLAREVIHRKEENSSTRTPRRSPRKSKKSAEMVVEPLLPVKTGAKRKITYDYAEPMSPVGSISAVVEDEAGVDEDENSILDVETI